MIPFATALRKKGKKERRKKGKKEKRLKKKEEKGGKRINKEKGQKMYDSALAYLSPSNLPVPPTYLGRYR
jgi:hypothetical protein